MFPRTSLSQLSTRIYYLINAFGILLLSCCGYVTHSTFLRNLKINLKEPALVLRGNRWARHSHYPKANSLNLRSLNDSLLELIRVPSPAPLVLCHGFCTGLPPGRPPGRPLSYRCSGETVSCFSCSGRADPWPGLLLQQLPLPQSWFRKKRGLLL